MTAHLRLESQVLLRRPRSNGILFSIRRYMLRLDELVPNRAWARRFHRVLETLPDDLADYKGLSRYRRTVIDFLAPFDDAA